MTMCNKSLIINKSFFGSLTRCECGMLHFIYNNLHWVFSHEELKLFFNTINNITSKDWEFSAEKNTWLITIPIFFERKIFYLLCNRKEFNNLSFILTGDKFNEEKNNINQNLILLN